MISKEFPQSKGQCIYEKANLEHVHELLSFSIYHLLSLKHNSRQLDYIRLCNFRVIARFFFFFIPASQRALIHTRVLSRAGRDISLSTAA